MRQFAVAAARTTKIKIIEWKKKLVLPFNIVIIEIAIKLVKITKNVQLKFIVIFSVHL